MAESAYSYALTTKARVKDKLGITVSTLDTVIDRLINSATDWIENACGGKRFLSTTYTNEVYSVDGPGQKYLPLRQSPVTALSALSYRAGTPSTPSWTAFTSDQYELVEDGKTGLVRVYFTLPYGENVVRATYTAGYLIAWAAAGDNSTHTLSADISELCDRLVVKAFKRREQMGKSSEGFEGSTVTWAREMDEDDKQTIGRYRRVQIV